MRFERAELEGSFCLCWLLISCPRIPFSWLTPLFSSCHLFVLPRRLVVLENGSGSPCIDLLRLDLRLVRVAEAADLVVLEVCPEEEGIMPQLPRLTLSLPCEHRASAAATWSMPHTHLTSPHQGMGRAVHSNYETPFTCDVLKTAMIKNAWLANKFGGNIYDVVCRFEQGAESVATPTRPADV